MEVAVNRRALGDRYLHAFHVGIAYFDVQTSTDRLASSRSPPFVRQATYA
jgi:hypothetical protein